MVNSAKLRNGHLRRTFCKGHQTRNNLHDEMKDSSVLHREATENQLPDLFDEKQTKLKRQVQKTDVRNATPV